MHPRITTNGLKTTLLPNIKKTLTMSFYFLRHRFKRQDRPCYSTQLNLRNGSIVVWGPACTVSRFSNFPSLILSHPESSFPFFRVAPSFFFDYSSSPSFFVLPTVISHISSIAKERAGSPLACSASNLARPVPSPYSVTQLLKRPRRIILHSENPNSPKEPVTFQTPTYLHLLY